MTSHYPTSRRDFLKTSLLGGAAALAVLRLPSAQAAQGAPAALTTFCPGEPVNSPMGVAFGAVAFNLRPTPATALGTV